jgi:hypothetical protein
VDQPGDLQQFLGIGSPGRRANRSYREERPDQPQRNAKSTNKPDTGKEQNVIEDVGRQTAQARRAELLPQRVERDKRRRRIHDLCQGWRSLLDLAQMAKARRDGSLRPVANETASISCQLALDLVEDHRCDLSPGNHPQETVEALRSSSPGFHDNDHIIDDGHAGF